MTITQLAPVKEKSISTDLTALSALRAPLLAVGDERIFAFTDALSAVLLKEPRFRDYSELVALGFWLRRANLSRYLQQLQDAFYKPLGLVVHYTPANVDTMFIYSWICALIMGNRNIVRVASQLSNLQQALIDCVNLLFKQEQHQSIALANNFIQFDKAQSVGESLSLEADARVLWGGDDSVSAIRHLPSRPRCRDISFADRYSATIIAQSGINEGNRRSVAQRVWRDMNTFDQQACSSPRLLFWCGDEIGLVRQLETLGNVASDTAFTEFHRNEQLVFSQWQQAEGNVQQAIQAGPICAVIQDPKAPSIIQIHPGQQILVCYVINELEELVALVDNKLQTLSYFGFEKEAFFKFLKESPIQGIDRIVPVGEALAFSPEWDGYDLLTQLARRVVFK
ncbi:hypothetical protein CA267_014240 [Alteromonas pelagimontana]|uniref:Long-chain-fatty-acyl-CoA reductase n=1 Tax=Alteromonas pelagimontana TaxID=1858656 RepID=A0A6M4MGX3_9ALTE|nr:acyl-CoA reductase [Alteromonas pelagimontana]QJR81835.1 hypothetical protein CA267_014240 [Alteromonas pelagimontana]